MALPRSPTSPICWPAVTVSPFVTVTARMWAYQVVSCPMPVLTCTSHRPAHPWSVRMSTRPEVAARTGVPQATDRSVPVCIRIQCEPWPPQLRLSTYRAPRGSGKVTLPGSTGWAQADESAV